MSAIIKQRDDRKNTQPDLGNTMRAMRREAGLTMKQAATMAGVSPGTVWTVEMGFEPTISTVSAIAKVYGYNARFVFAKEGGN